MLIIGLTGTIGTGKSATARMFADLGIPVYDADAAVHRIYDVGGSAVAPVEAAFPGVVRDGRVDRQRLSAAIIGKPDAIRRLEAIVHPLVRAEQAAFLARCRGGGARMAILEVPLLFETGGDEKCDLIVVTSVPPEIRRARVMQRDDMSADKLDAILARQMPDADKRRRAHFVVETGDGFEAARAQVADIVRAISALPGSRFY